MIAAIERPRPEVWPMRTLRAMPFNALLPGIVDRAMARYRSGVEAANRR